MPHQLSAHQQLSWCSMPNPSLYLTPFNPSTSWGEKKKKKSSYCLPTRLAFYSNNIHTVSKSNQFKFTFVTVTRFSWKSNLKAQTEIIQSLSISHTHTQTHTQQLKAIIWLTSPCYCPGAGAVPYGPRWYQGCSKGLDKVCGKVRALSSGPNDHNLSQLITEATLLLTLFPGPPHSRSLTFVL